MTKRNIDSVSKSQSQVSNSAKSKNSVDKGNKRIKRDDSKSAASGKASIRDKSPAKEVKKITPARSKPAAKQQQVRKSTSRSKSTTPVTRGKVDKLKRHTSSVSQSRSTSQPKQKKSPDSVYSKSYKYKNSSNTRGGKVERNARGKSPAPTKSTVRKNSRESKPVKKSPAKSLKSSNSKSTQKTRRTNPDRKIDPRISEKWGIDNDSILEVIEYYFEYLVDEKHSKQKLNKIEVGKMLEKKIVVKTKQIIVKYANVTFHMKSAVSTKDFNTGDIIEFTGSTKHKKMSNHYLVRNITVSLDYSKKKDVKSSVEKQDDTLPDVDITFGVHPIVQEKKLSQFPEALKAQEKIAAQVSNDFKLDHQGNICLFELGYRYGKKMEEQDKRLEFEYILVNLPSVCQGKQFLNTNQGIEADLKAIKSANSLNQNKYNQKQYIVYYGYKYENPKEIYMVDFRLFQRGIDLGIKKWTKEGLKTVTAKSETIKADESVSKSIREEEFSQQAKQPSPVKSTNQEIDPILGSQADIPMSKSLGKIANTNLEEVHSRGRSGRLNKIKPISIEKSKIEEQKIEESQTESEQESELQTIVVPPNKATVSVSPAKKPKSVQSSQSDGLSRGRQRRRQRLPSESAHGSQDSSEKSKGSNLRMKPTRNKRVTIPVKKSRIIQEDSQDEDVSMAVDEEPVSQQPRGRGMRKNRRPSPSREQSQNQSVGFSSDSGDDNSVMNDPAKNKFDSKYDEACAKLQLNSIPNYFPCREKEQEQITSYLRDGIKNKQQSSSLYISGMPGTGKTATVLEILRNLMAEKKAQKKGRQTHAESLKDFEFIHINAMSLANPNLVYTILCEKIIGRRLNPQSSAQFLSDFFKKNDKDKKSIALKYMSKSTTKTKKIQEEAQRIANKVRVVLIDELDALITTKQTLLYNLFDWPCYKDSKLLLISIANTMDLPERLQQKITSRIGNNRLVYEPYTSAQIKVILESRLKDIDIFDVKSLELVSKKVAQYSGDIRRSLQITKRAVEICRNKYIKEKQQQLIKVTMSHVLSAYEEMQNSKTAKVLLGLRKFEIVVLIALQLELTVGRCEKVLMDKVQDRCEIILNKLKKSSVHILRETKTEDGKEIKMYEDWASCQMTTTMFREIIKRLQAFGLINLIVETHKITDNCHLQIQAYYDELKNAFGNDEIYISEKVQIELHKEQE